MVLHFALVMTSFVSPMSTRCPTGMCPCPPVPLALYVVVLLAYTIMYLHICYD